MAHNQFEKGITSGILHFLFGAVFGAAVVSCLVWMIWNPSLWLQLSAAGALVFGVAAAIWRGRFWAALANNPLVWAWSALFGRGR